MAGITVSGVTIDCAEPEKLAAWWARVHIDFGAVDVQVAVDRLVAMGATIAWEEDFPAEPATATSCFEIRRATSSVSAARPTPRPAPELRGTSSRVAGAR